MPSPTPNTKPGSQLVLELPWPPSVNTYWRRAKLNNWAKERTIISQKGRKYRTDVRLALMDHVMPPTLEGPLSVVVDLHPPDNRRRDIDNYTKGLYDALSHWQVWEDDHQVREHLVRFQPKTLGGLVVLKIATIEEGI